MSWWKRKTPTAVPVGPPTAVGSGKDIIVDDGFGHPVKRTLLVSEVPVGFESCPGYMNLDFGDGRGCQPEGGGFQVQRRYRIPCGFVKGHRGRCPDGVPFYFYLKEVHLGFRVEAHGVPDSPHDSDAKP